MPPSPSVPSAPELTATPDTYSVLLSWDNSAESEVDPLVGAADFEGYRIYRATFSPGEWELIAAFDNIDEPVYVFDFETGDTLFDGKMYNLPSGMNNSTGLSEFSITMGHSYYDTLLAFIAKDTDGNEIEIISNISRPINNLPYFYVVTAYDNPAAHDRPEFPQIESARSNYRVNPETGAPDAVYPRKFYSLDESWDGQKVSVYPNPYKGASPLEARYENKINFTHLPPACKISIFSLTGDLIIEILHNDGSADHSWDLSSRSELNVVSGLYLYVVESSLSTYPPKQIGKFVILRGEH